MRLKNVFRKQSYIALNDNAAEEKVDKTPSVPEGMWIKCGKCGSLAYKEDIIHNHMICTTCGNYFRMDARTRILMIADEGTFEEWDTDMQAVNPLDFEGYQDKVKALKESTGLNEAVVTGVGKIDGNKAVIGVCDTQFMMGSMGHIVGEKVTRAFERAAREKLPVILFTCSGGARMQEGIISLMQMEKTAAAVKRHSNAGLLYITVLTDPTTGGVTASFAMLGDIILAEPGALIGFAGPRVIKQTIGQELPEGFQRAEFLLKHGFVDSVVERKELKGMLSKLLRQHSKAEPEGLENYYAGIIKKWNEHGLDLAAGRQKKADTDSWKTVEKARRADRPAALDYINCIFKEFTELHGDRLFSDDGAIVGGTAFLGDLPVTVIGQQKGKTAKENIVRNFGMPYPEGYRKVKRLIKQAEKFNRPVVCFVDTPGAYPGIGAEERGQGEAIASCLAEFSDLKVPVLSIIIGEGGSGGALAMAAADEVWMMENSIYSVLSPEGFASILWKDSKKAAKAAQVMKITAADLYELGVIEKIIPEFPVAAADNIKKQSFVMKRYITEFMLKRVGMDKEQLIRERYDRFRRF